MADAQRAEEYDMQSGNADLEREKVIARIRKMEQQEQKENRKEAGNTSRTNTGKIRFDFIDLMDYSARREVTPKDSYHIVSDDMVLDDTGLGEDDAISQEKVEESIQPLQLAEESMQPLQPAGESIRLTQLEADDNNQSLLSLSREDPAEEMSTVMKIPENSQPAEELTEKSVAELTEKAAEEPAAELTEEPAEVLTEEPVKRDVIQPEEKKERKKSVYETDQLFAPMLKRAEDISLAAFLANDTDEELAVSVGGELYINTAASIRLLVKAGHASLHMKPEEAGKLWGTVCFYSIDAGYTNMAFWNIANVVYKSDSAKAKAILKVIIKKEKKLMQIIDECLSRNKMMEE